MNNPLRILTVIDRRLVRETRLVIYGRAAFALGFPEHASLFGATRDVDAILPDAEMTALEADDQFWAAVDAANRELEPEGLYVTHLFPDSQVILTRDWLHRIVPLETPFQRLRVHRPSNVDLLLTKMMRSDPDDLADAEFLIRTACLGLETVRRALDEAVIPDVDEIRAAFAANTPRILRALGDPGHSRPSP